MAGVSDELMLGDDTSGIESSHGREAEDEYFNYSNNKLPSDTSSSDFTRGTPTETVGTTDDLQAPFVSDEANSAANMYSLGVDFSSNLIQVYPNSCLFLFKFINVSQGWITEEV